MKPCRMFAGLLILLLIVGVVVFIAAMQHHPVYATPNTESAFLRNYSPKHALAPYKTEADGEWWSDGKAEGAGEGYAHRQLDFHGEIAILGNDLTPLTNALNEDVRQQLSHSGAKILDQSASLEHGFRYSYQSGKSLGELIVAPPHISNAKLDTTDGRLRVAIDIYLDEKWFPTKAE